MAKLNKNELRLTVNGKTLEGFEGGSVTLSMEEPYNTFELDYVADGRQLGARVIFAGDECELKINAGRGDESLIKGYVDSTIDDDAAEAVLLRCSGRSKTADLVDCSAHRPGRWKSFTVSSIARAIAEPYGVAVFLEADEGAPLASFAIVAGETAFEAIQRACARRYLTCYAVAGYLVLAQAGPLSSLTALERGRNVVRSSRTDSWRNRYSEYVFLAQARGTDDSSGKAVSQIKATSKDATITRHRQLIQQVGANDQVELQSRADFDRSRRAGLGETFNVVVGGWGTDEGKVWRPNTLVSFKNEVLGVDAELIVSQVHFTFGAHAAREAELTLMRPEAYLPEKPYPVLRRGGKTR
jgi:prophage tail gpP-like protein